MVSLDIKIRKVVEFDTSTKIKGGSDPLYPKVYME